MKKCVVVVLILLCFPIIVKAGRGCCSRNGGVCGCTSYGITICCSGKVSESENCTCTPPKVSGCTDPDANNYNPDANSDNGSCKYDVYGCTDKDAYNYDAKANINDYSCKYHILGCMDINATNYNASATKDDGSCQYEVLGCMDISATNYNASATKDDGSCQYEILGCMDISATNYNANATKDDGSCQYETVENNIIDNSVNEEIIDSKQDNEKSYQYTDYSDDESILDILKPLAIIGCGGYYGYKKIKEKKK